ncbi:hypothetical protein OC845_006720 [Tilletia horrida]|nr:hypothetical protein OC845_006720 [Tilletia horrida]
MFGLKLRNLPLALPLTSLAVTGISATPSAIDASSEGSLDLFGRAVHTGKYKGARCSSNSECYSKYCILYDHTYKTCQLQPPGGPCFESGNCNTMNCNTAKGTCITPSNLNGFCNGDSAACAGSLQCDRETYSCRRKAGSKCSKASECVTGTPCTNGVCSTAKLAPNQPCNADDQCSSGSCTWRSVCHRDDGGYAYCAELNGYETFGLCDTYPLGHSCVNPGDCTQGQCKSGACRNSTVGVS